MVRGRRKGRVERAELLTEQKTGNLREDWAPRDKMSFFKFS